MRHLKRGRKFGRKKNARRALIRNLTFAFLEKGRITTTAARAKELRPVVEKLISAARSRDTASVRRISRVLPRKAVVKLFSNIAPRYSGRNGGYTRIIRLGRRKSDASAMAILELT